MKFAHRLIACAGVFLLLGLAIAQKPPGPLAFPEESPAEKNPAQKKDKAMEKVLGPHSYSLKDFQAETTPAKVPEATQPSNTSPTSEAPASEKSPPDGDTETKTLPPTSEKTEPILPGVNPERAPAAQAPAKSSVEVLPFAPTPVKPAPESSAPEKAPPPSTPANEPVVEKEPKESTTPPVDSDKEPAVEKQPTEKAPPAPDNDETAVQGKKDPKDKIDPKDKKDPKKGIDVEQAPLPEMFAQAPSADSEGPEGMNPHMIGDILGLSGLQVITVSVTNSTHHSTSTFPYTTVAKVPVTFPGAFKIAENESPAPMDRLFFTFNFFGNVHGPDLPRTGFVNVTGTPTKVTLSDSPPAPSFDFYREVFGFEKTFLDGAASVGIRVPIFQERGDDPFNADEFGDITLIGKYVLWRGDEAGNLVSAGLALTVPTGPRVNTIEGNIHPVLFQPYVGYMCSVGDLYLHGFLSVLAPTDSNFPTMLFNDIGIGYWLYRGDDDAFLRSIVPTLEAHVTTPLNDRGADDPITIPDLVVLTAGVHLDLAGRSRLTMGLATPVTGPHTFSIEAIAQLNWLF